MSDPTRSTRFTLTFADGSERDVHYSDPLTLDEAADRVWAHDEEFNPDRPNAIAGITIMCDSSNAQPPEFEGDAFCSKLAGHSGPHDDGTDEGAWWIEPPAAPTYRDSPRSQWAG